MDEKPKNTPPACENWSEAIEDLVSAGDTDAAISALESLIAKLESAGDSTSPEPDRQLASALSDLAGLYSSRGFTLKADRIHSQAALLRHRLLYPASTARAHNETPKDDESPSPSRGNVEKSTGCGENSDDDWEAIVDRSPDKLLSPQSLPGVSKLSLEDTGPKVPKRRGRGTFSYRKEELYSDRESGSSVIDDVDDGDGDGDGDGDSDVRRGSESNREIRHSTYGTRHALVLTGFAPSTNTIDLEKLFVDFKDHGFVIRWLDDTSALAVFGTPSLALEAKNSVSCPFSVNVLGENDDILSSIPPEDLEPPRQRPKTSARTAQRLIAQGMGLKLPTSFGSRELRKQEVDRKNRIVSRQKLKDDAWGTED